MTDPCGESAVTLAARIRSGATTSSAVVAAHLARIDAVNPTINALVQRADQAMAAAEAADRALAQGTSLGPLHGVPFTVKDWLETNDLVCSAGFAERAGYRPARDASAVARLRAAGAILLGKTKAGAEEDLYPITRNPHDAEHTAGASSSGEAAIIASGGSPLGLGSDSGGSLRWPAHCCGIATLKPSSGAVPLTGHFPRIGPLSDPRTVIGPMARSVADLETALHLLVGEDGIDPSVVPAQFAPMPTRPLRVAWFTAFGGATADSATESAVHRAVDALAAGGADVQLAVPPGIDEAFSITKAYWARPESTSLSAWRPERASSLSADEVEESLFRWDRLRRTFLAYMGKFDVVLCPVAATAAPRRLTIRWDDYVFTAPFSLTGYPVVVVPVAKTTDGLPIGVQVVARNFGELVALGAARQIESAVQFFAPSG